MHNEIFYASAATVIPLLLIAIMATRSFRPGEFHQQPAVTVAIFGLPIAGEIAAFAFLFFEPLPTTAAVLLALMTWIGLISQLSLATWWLTELIRHPNEASTAAPALDTASEAQAKAASPDPRLSTKESEKNRTWTCPACETTVSSSSRVCDACRTPAPRDYFS